MDSTPSYQREEASLSSESGELPQEYQPLFTKEELLEQYRQMILDSKARELTIALLRLVGDDPDAVK